MQGLPGNNKDATSRLFSLSRSREGKYHGVQDDNTRKQLQHSKLTNLTGEQAFGDLDFSLFKRRNASLHHHSTINMLKGTKVFQRFSISKHQKNSTASFKFNCPGRRRQLCGESTAKMKRMPLPGDSLFWRKLTPRRSPGRR